MASVRKVLNSLEKLSDNLVRLALYVAAVTTILIASLVVIEILCRKILGFSTLVSGEMSEYGLCLVILFGTGDLFKRKKHLAVDVITNLISTRFGNVFELIFSFFAFGVYSTILTYYCFQLALESYKLHIVAVTFSRTPLWIPQSMMVLGLLVLDLACITEIVKWFTNGSETKN
jgi:TRAP-type C4-dicarboxylate transport system permease small subunit